MLNYGNIRSWHPPQAFTPTNDLHKRAQAFKVAPFILHLLSLRGITDLDAIDAFLNPKLSDLPPPFTMKDMEKAVELVFQAILSKRKIFIWGDYDVDGVTATSLLVNFFQEIGIIVDWKIPNRFLEGYGLNIESLKEVRTNLDGENPLLITVDCGITSHEEILTAKSLGFTIIVTDHHEPPHIPVSADAILNTRQQDCAFIEKNLSGVGTAFYLAAGIRSKLKGEGYFSQKNEAPNLKQFLDLVAIGTIADMVSLTGINRILVKAGLEALTVSRNLGMRELLRDCDITNETIVSDDIAFQVAPKINAAGRLESADLAVNLLLCSEPKEAARLARKISGLNDKRKEICREIVDSTLTNNDILLKYNNNCIVLKKDFHQGVIGIAASQLANAYNLPAILFTEGSPINARRVLKGSGRSVPGINLMEILKKCDRFLLKYGGHAMAAGMSLFAENFEMFYAGFSDALREQGAAIHHNEQYSIDLKWPIERIFDEGILEQLQKLEPFGIGNKKPIFSDHAAIITDYKVFGHNGNHLKVNFRGKYRNITGVGFNLGKYASSLHRQTPQHIIYTPAINRFNRTASWEVRLLDIL